jgi:RNA polymerase primary sigma factor
MITPAEEVDLARRIRSGDEKALEKLVKSNLRFVVSVAKQYQLNGMTLSDLINEGNLGLIKAASRFDETRGFKFISYAVWWIRQSILQALAEQSRIVRLPLNRVGSLNKINQTFSALEQLHHREPTDDELAEMMETTPEEIRKTLSYRSRKVSMDAPMSHDADAGTLLDVMADESAQMPDADMITHSMQQEIRRALANLSEREAQVISLHYGLSGGRAVSLHEIGDQFELSMERVRQIKEKATRKLRQTARIEALKAFL